LKFISGNLIKADEAPVAADRSSTASSYSTFCYGLLSLVFFSASEIELSLNCIIIIIIKDP